MKLKQSGNYLKKQTMSALTLKRMLTGSGALKMKPRPFAVPIVTVGRIFVHKHPNSDVEDKQ